MAFLKPNKTSRSCRAFENNSHCISNDEVYYIHCYGLPSNREKRRLSKYHKTSLSDFAIKHSLAYHSIAFEAKKNTL